MGMWPGEYWLKSSLLDDSLKDIIYGGGGGGEAGEGGGERELCDVAGRAVINFHVTNTVAKKVPNRFRLKSSLRF
jgi:hypothetical protein